MGRRGMFPLFAIALGGCLQATTSGPAPVPDVPGQKPIPEYLGLGLGQQMLMKARDE